MPPKAKGAGKRARETEKPLSGLDVDALLRGEKRTRISDDNAVPEFKQALKQTENMEGVEAVAKQMSEVVENQIRHSLGNSNYDRVMEMLQVMQSELNDYEAPTLFNNLLRRLKDELLTEKLGGNREELWYRLRKDRLGLIDQSMSDFSNVTEEEAKKVCKKRETNWGEQAVMSGELTFCLILVPGFQVT